MAAGAASPDAVLAVNGVLALGIGWLFASEAGAARLCSGRASGGRRWQALPQGLDESLEADDSDVSYHGWLRKRSVAVASGGRVCFSFWRSRSGGSAFDMDRDDDDDNDAAGSVRDLDTLTIRELLQSEVSVTLLGLRATSVSAERLAAQLRSAQRVLCSFEAIQFACAAGDLEPWLDTAIVATQQALFAAQAKGKWEVPEVRKMPTSWSYVDGRDSASAPMQLREIRRSRLDNEAAEAMGFAMQANPTLRSVFLQLTPIRAGLAAGIRAAPLLSSLSLSTAEIGTEGGEGIGGARSLAKLQIERSTLSEGGALALAAGLRSIEPLEELRLMSCQLGPPGAAALAESACLCPKIRTLFLVDVGLGDAGVTALANGLHSCGGAAALQTLLLQRNGIGDVGAAALARAVAGQLPALTLLRLDSNAIGTEGMAGVEALCQALANARVRGTGRIERICMEGNPMGAEARAELLGCCGALGVATDVALMPAEAR